MMMSWLSANAAMGLTVLNAVLCAGIMWACVCRIAVMTEETTSKYFRLSYALMAAMAAGSGGSYWLFGEQPGPGQIGLALAMIVWLGVGMHNWRGGPPYYARLGRFRFMRRRGERKPPVVDVEGKKEGEA